MVRQETEQGRAQLAARAQEAVAQLADSLRELAESRAAPAGSVEEALQEALQPVMEELWQIQARLDDIETGVRAAAAAVRRLGGGDGGGGRRETVVPIPGPVPGRERSAGRGAGEPRRYVRKDETVRLALEAAREILAEGGKVSMRAVARRARLTYAQVVYAFGRTENLRERLRKEDGAGRPASGGVLAYDKTP